MKNIIDSGHGRSYCGKIPDIGFDQFDFISDGRNVLFITGRKVIINPDPVSSGYKRLGHVRADKAAPSGNQINH
jgi:hypothetical protein